MSENKHAPLGI